MKTRTCIMAAVVICGLLTAAFTFAEDKATLGNLNKFPQPEGGMAALAKAVVYPEAAKKDSVTGTVYVQVKILSNGTIAATKIERGVRADLDSAAVKAIRSVRWEPGENEVGPVAAWVVVPMQFKLENTKK